MTGIDLWFALWSGDSFHLFSQALAESENLAWPEVPLPVLIDTALLERVT